MKQDYLIGALCGITLVLGLAGYLFLTHIGDFS